ncbi:MAG TPA: transcriptional regulator [Chthoniobacterales bacterium]
MSDASVDPAGELHTARDEFVAQWGAIGNAWGINRTMAQIHALLITAPAPMSTDEVMDDLKISRGNANGNLRELVSWGLIRSVLRRGDRKEYFEAEKDVWKMFCAITRERRRREVSPAIDVLRNVVARSASIESPAAAAFNEQVATILSFLETADSVMEKVARSEQNSILPWALKFLK